jgi:hypothetical protein
MSSTDTRTVDPAQPHPSENGGHEMSDFSWSTVLWLLPISILILLVFFAVCISWFKGAKDHELEVKQAAFTTTELNRLHAKESEVLSQYKVVDKDKGRFQIPIARAMELIAQEHQNAPGRKYVPITDTYLEGAAFTSPKAASKKEGPSSGISIETAPDADATTKGAKPTHPTKPHVSGKAAEPAQDASKEVKPHSAPGGGASEKAH